MIDACTADAVKYLDEASAEGDGSLHSLVLRHLAAMQGIGYAVLAVYDKLGELTDAADDSNRQLTEITDTIAMAIPEPRTPILERVCWRLWGRWRAKRAWYTEAGFRLPDAGDVPVLLQALVDAASLRQGTVPGDCMDCVRAQADAELSGQPDAAAGLERCDVHARDGQLSAAYAALRYRLLGGES